MAAKKTRYNELLGIDNSIRDPDLYQLLGLDRAAFDAGRVDPSFRERMKTLQSIKSPKHKSFIEFLKGELRRAKSTLVKADRRQAYDAELLEERRDQLTRILDVVLADNVLTDVEEERIQQVALDVGLLPAETQRVLDEELRARGATRERAGGPPAAGPAPAPPPPAPRGRSANSSDIHKAINRSLGNRKPPPKKTGRPALKRPTGRRGAKPQAPPPKAAKPKPKPAPPKPTGPVVAEYVGPPKAPTSDWGQVAKPARATGWGKASVVRQVGVCAGCLKPVEDVELNKGSAERLADGRLHCTACTNQLVAGLICSSCYQRITRADMKAKDVVQRAGRVSHGRCTR